MEYGKPPLSPKNMMNITNGAIKKTEKVIYTGSPIQNNNYNTYASG
jgi:hypothetical protein